jgi:hypothetical protein
MRILTAVQKYRRSSDNCGGTSDCQGASAYVDMNFDGKEGSLLTLT